MSRIILAFRAFFAVLFGGQSAERVRQALTAAPAAAVSETATARTTQPSPAPDQARPAPPQSAGRSDALSLLAALQREARLVDFLLEPIGEYSDAQIGAAVRDVHRDCRKLLDRMFALRPAIAGSEGDAIEVPAGFDAARYRLTGNVGGQAPLHGRLAHPGWEASRCELPTWTGDSSSARIIAPAEVEV